jgi:asparagine synthase (glutamine-hydrolysing)
MCGIYGYLSLIEGNKIGHAVEQAVDSIRHRGPDEGGQWEGDGIFLGMRRLSIIDLVGGQQPIWNEDNSCVIIYNGELYNFLDLRPELENLGHVFRTYSDTEVILHGYEEWGPACLKRFNGMFAFAIWDNKDKTLFLARDRIGEKPLYYYKDDERIIFASEIKAIISHPAVPRKINLKGLANFLAFGHAIAPETIFQKIFKLLPGHYLLVRYSHLLIKSYWDVGDDPQISQGHSLSEQDYQDLVLALLNDSVRRRMIADVPVGAFLSGGVDSSAVVALMLRHATDTVKTFSLGFNVGGVYNELADARRVAKYLGSEHYEMEVGEADLIRLLRKLIYHYDEPFGDTAGFPLYLLSYFAREHVKVVLAGDGGDELFAGYRRYIADHFAESYQMLPDWLIRKFIPNFIERFPRLRRLKRILHTLPISNPARRYANWLVYFSPEMQQELLQPDIFREIADYDPAWPYPKYYYNYHGLNHDNKDDNINRLLYIDLKTWLPDTYMEKVDKATMACSLEARLPLLDYRLVELAFQIPGRYKISGLASKTILKKAVSGLVPDEVLKKPKHGFAVPTDPWFRGPLKSFTYEVLLDDRTLQRGYLNRKVVESLWREHINGCSVLDMHLWLLLNLELWQRIYLDGESP